jgi:Flp pilus assembly protein TadG
MISRLGAFAADRKGNFGIMAAVLTVPLVMSVGLAMDYGTMTRVRSHLQNTTDAAALAIAREGSLITQAQSEDIARKFLQATLGMPFKNLKVVRVGTKITVSATVNSGLQFTALFAGDKGNVTTASTADIGTMSYEIGLVLDTTGSMAGGKLAAMKDAVVGLIDTMSAQVKEKDKLKFAMVPFATFVNVGPQYGPGFDPKGKQSATGGAKWLDLKGLNSTPQVELAPGASRFQIFANVGQSWPGCVETRYADGQNYDISDEPPLASKPETLFVPAFAPDEPDGYQNSYIASSAKPNVKTVDEQKKRWKKYGVKTDISGEPLDGGLIDGLVGVLLGTKKVIPIDSSTAYGTNESKGPGFGCTMQAITPLSTDFTDLKRKVNALVASGNTNITEGVAWGMRVLSPGEPFTQGSAPGKASVRKILIILTDGSNVLGANGTDLRSRYSSNGYMVDGRLGFTEGGETDANKAMNLRTLAACQAAKDQKMEVYTIKLEEPNVKTGDMLKECASKPENYVDVPNRSRLDEAFQDIIDRVTMVRLAS